MVGQLITQLPISFDEFLAWYPAEGSRYELIRGEIVEAYPIGAHELIAAYLCEELALESRRLKLPYVVSRNTLVKPLRAYQGALPDVIVLDKQTLADDPYWSRSSTISKGASARLVIEIVSTNWQDDYAYKVADYEQLGIPEYWIIDYQGLGGVRYIGSPKQPTITVYTLVEEEYQGSLYRLGDTLRSTQFPELVLTLDQIITASH
ncbi:Uma2 family endonuclease [Pseudanabaena sp. FACHB-2040]|uniref:Uma2 family endonuclease n=1 Tax=Pseudanabaena sp. FACHB-2040 TaxID=2692859 RepID=UPI00168209C2|nr:Uma2 family endonuclease [Pseudanabaena sp. FACHB-2040]MBD2261045.1 Uma2 family endonuclease [Pseudanabaena sp. FACHB-2040]